MATETLFCEVGKHKWKRESKRGRKPRTCPDHKPQPVELTEAELATREEKLARTRKKTGEKLGQLAKQQAEERRKQQLVDLRQQLVTAKAAKKKASRDYARAFEAAAKKAGYDKEAWDLADRFQSLVLSLGSTINHITAKLEGGR